MVNIKNIRLPDNAKLVSLEVQNLFPSIQPQETVELVDLLVKSPQSKYPS